MAALLLLGACGDGVSGPSPGSLTLAVRSGDGAFAAPGQTLTVSASVLTTLDGTGYAGAEVRWAVASGDAALRPGADVVSDSAGTVVARVDMGPTPGPVVVQVALRSDPAVEVAFRLTTADIPVLTALSAASASPGGPLRLEGRGFSPRPGDNVVLVGGVRADVVSASPETLDVAVPPCLPPGPADVDVRFGSLASAPLSVTVAPGGDAAALEAGASIDLDAPAGPACLRLDAPEAGAAYLVVASSTSEVGAARYEVTLRGRVRGPDGAVPAGSGARADAALDARSVARAAVPPWPARWEAELRAAEAALPGGAPPARPSASAAGPGPAAVPRIGERRSFRVLNRESGFDDVDAVVRWVGRRVVFYVDAAAPNDGFTDGHLEELAALFDEAIHPEVTGTFGEPSDLDGNDRVVVLFTPTVNALTPRGSDGYVAGFFYGVDLLPERPGSNAGEVFYAVVPDPVGRFSDPHSVSDLLGVVPPVLAHEFQHMVHFNQRVLQRGAPWSDAVWLSEGLAQMAEEVLARRFERAGGTGGLGRVEMFRKGNRSRARRYLSDPGAVSLLIGTGQGSLEERGAGWLFALYLEGLVGDGALGDLTRTVRTGSDNVAAVAGRGFGSLLQDWWAALYLDGRRLPSGARHPLSFPGADLPRLLDGVPLDPPVHGDRDFLITGRLWSASAAHYIVEPPPGGSVTLRMGGEGQGEAPPGSSFRLRVVRLR